MLTLRLQRTGKRNQANFRIVLAEKTAPVKKKCLEVLGSYDPIKKDFKVKEERLKYWISQKVQISPTLHNLLVTKNLLQEAKIKAFKIKKKEKKEEKTVASQVKNQAVQETSGQPEQKKTQETLSETNIETTQETPNLANEDGKIAES